MTIEETPARPELRSDLGPLDQLRAGRMTRRLTQLALGLFLYGASLAMMVRAGLGLAPWDVLHSGLVRHVPVTLGQMVVLTSFAVLLLWIPLAEVPGLGTLANAVAVGLAADATLAVLSVPEPLWARAGLMLAGVVLNALATAAYIGSQLGRGARDGLMTGLARRTGSSLRLVRTGIEASVVLLGLVLGGVLGLGTVLYALAIGPLAQLALPWFTVRLDPVGPSLSGGWRSGRTRRARSSPRRR
ncbi:YczE/YyaS/YitT family protein [Nocardioides houyundeii]|uniref:membrane protein YczE n=1 Tax=Nocardioides houyundeii TaxID=2045452 RepID=UPI001F080345|nr:hypothetical protein [Nocardioides houyundeii]